MKHLCRKILPNGKAGFIAGHDGKDYYFRLNSFRDPRGKLKSGLGVKFYTEKSIDPQKCDTAIEIEAFTRLRRKPRPEGRG